MDRQVAFAVLRFRLHGLKRFRAAFGPDAASSLLRAVAHTLVTSLPRTDMIGRWANDEFLVILNSCGGGSPAAVRKRLRRLLADDFIEWWGERRSLPVSITEATVQAEDTLQSILDRTQESLDHAFEWLSRASAARDGESPGS